MIYTHDTRTYTRRYMRGNEDLVQEVVLRVEALTCASEAGGVWKCEGTLDLQALAIRQSSHTNT